MVKNPPADAGDAGNTVSIPGSGLSPGVENDNPLQYSCLENTMGQKSLADYSPWGHMYIYPKKAHHVSTY